MATVTVKTLINISAGAETIRTGQIVEIEEQQAAIYVARGFAEYVADAQDAAEPQGEAGEPAAEPEAAQEVAAEQEPAAVADAQDAPADAPQDADAEAKPARKRK